MESRVVLGLIWLPVLMDKPVDYAMAGLLKFNDMVFSGLQTCTSMFWLVCSVWKRATFCSGVTRF